MKAYVKRLTESGMGLIFTSVVLVFAVVALFLSNVGFGWFSSNKEVSANGIGVQMSEIESPVVAHQLYKVLDAKIVAGDDTVHHRYAFLRLTPQEIAEMDLGNYSRLEAPTYHLLMHISLDKDVSEVYIDTQVDDGSYELVKADVADMVVNNQAVGLCSALEMFALKTGTISTDQLDWVEDYQIKDTNGNVTQTEDVFVLDGLALPEDGELFSMTESDDKTTVTFTGKTAAFHISATDLRDVDGDGYKDLFIFMTYSTARVNLLQDYATGGGRAMGDNMISFLSNFSFFVREGGN